MDNGWRRNKYGGLFKLNDYMNSYIRSGNSDNIYIDKDGRVYEVKKKEEKNGDVSYGHIGLNEKGEEKAWLEYVKLNNNVSGDSYRFNGTKYQISGIKVDENYKRKGLGTRLYKEIGKISNHEEIKFGTLTKEGKSLVDSVAVITRIENYANETLYYGKIKEWFDETRRIFG